jgi:hypothetical protein
LITFEIVLATAAAASNVVVVAAAAAVDFAGVTTLDRNARSDAREILRKYDRAPTAATPPTRNRH